jgi:hypothetical protein
VKAYAITMHTDPFVNGILDPQVPVLLTTAVAYLGIYFERARARVCVCVVEGEYFSTSVTTIYIKLLWSQWPHGLKLKP